MFELLTPLSYWVLIVLWAIILGLYLVRLRRLSAAGGGIAVLLTILALDAFRTLFESAYFGLYFNSLFGIFPSSIGESLGRPELMIIPKLVNIVAGVLVLVLLIRRWLPKEVAAEERRIRELAQSEERMHLALAGGALGTWDWNVKTGEVAFDARWAGMLGYQLTELEPRQSTWERLVHTDDRARMVEILDAHFSGETDSFNGEYRMRHKSGDWHWVVARGEVLERDATGRPLRMCGTHLDITERRQAEEEALRFSRVLEESLNEIYLFDATTLRFVTVNHGARQNLGYTLGELRDLTPLDLKPEFDRESFAELLEPLRSKAERKVTLVTKHRRKDGSFYPVEINLQLTTVGHPVFVAIALDTTERTLAQQERDGLQAQLLHSQKMEAVGRLAGGVAHDFNNVLCVITCHADLAIEDLAEEDPMHSSMSEIATAASRAAELTRQLLAFSRKQIIEPKVIDLSAIIEEVDSMLARLLGANVELMTKPKKPLWRTRADPGQIEQIVVNLAINARDAMPDGGELIIETSEVTLEDMDYVMLTVRDNGEGITAEDQKRIFEPFFTTKEVGKGTGLGLATVFGIVQQHGGRIEVKSEVGQGAAFSVYFPRVLEEVTPIAAEAVVVASAVGETVLVVEDDEPVRLLAVRVLERGGYHVLSAGSGAAALTVSSRHDGVIDLLLTDVVMPRMNGRDLAVALTEIHSDLRVLFTSGYTRDVIAHHGVLDAGVRFLAKPYTPSSLTEKVRKTLDGARTTVQASVDA